MKTLPTLLASLTLSSGMVSCVGTVPMHPGNTISLYAPIPNAARPTVPLNIHPRVTHMGSSNVAQFATPVSVNPMLTSGFTQAVARPVAPLAVNPRFVQYTGGSDYQPQLASEYRNGWRAGAQDAAYGVNRDYRRAYACQGTGWESYFQEGYNDGYEGRPMAH